MRERILRRPQEDNLQDFRLEDCWLGHSGKTHAPGYVAEAGFCLVGASTESIGTLEVLGG